MMSRPSEVWAICVTQIIGDSSASTGISKKTLPSSRWTVKIPASDSASSVITSSYGLILPSFSGAFSPSDFFGVPSFSSGSSVFSGSSSWATAAAGEPANPASSSASQRAFGGRIMRALLNDDAKSATPGGSARFVRRDPSVEECRRTMGDLGRITGPADPSPGRRP